MSPFVSDTSNEARELPFVDARGADAGPPTSLWQLVAPAPGVEGTLAVAHLAPFLLTGLLRSCEAAPVRGLST